MDRAIVEVEPAGINVAGQLGFLLWRSVYLTKQASTATLERARPLERGGSIAFLLRARPWQARVPAITLFAWAPSAEADSVRIPRAFP